ncbi:MAG: hypothetical protein ABIQ31_09235 [Ferruginibacter sp.]
MKTLIFFLLTFFYTLAVYPQSVGVNNDGTPPDPSALLDVKSNTKGVLVPRMTSAERTGIASPAIGLLVYDNETGSFWYYKALGWTELTGGSNGPGASWNTSGTNIYNSNMGNVGIGTTTPVNKLTIQTPINSLGWTHIGGADSIIVTEGVGGVSASIGTATNHAFRINTNGQGRLSVYPAGEVVIGSNLVGAIGKLTVQTTNNTYGISHLGEGGNIFATYMGGTSAGIGTFSHTNMRIFSNGISRILIAEATGNVGIGTDNPTYKLSVVGNIRATEVVVETGWADYVFDKKYKLRPLSEVEQFIHQNNHLPNIPSSGEVQEHGLLLGNTQKLMMEKIEELTLYMIGANKKIEALEEAIRMKE